MNHLSKKPCSKCKKIKNLKRFYYHRTNKDRRMGHCKECDIKKRKEFKERFFERENKTIRNAYLKRNYGISLEDYNIMFQSQMGKCAICGIHQMETTFTFCIDHNHETKKNRGILCIKCNTGIGALKDNIQLLKKAIKYLEAYV